MVDVLSRRGNLDVKKVKPSLGIVPGEGFFIYMVCIYCLQDKSSDQFKKREHVLPQCFGKFSPGNLILNGMVCDDCNQYLGNHLELPLGRDTIWGVLRYRHGIKPRAKPKPHKRMKFRVSNKELLGGLAVSPIYSDKGNGMDNEPVPQAGIFNNLINREEYYPLGEIPKVDDLKEQGREIKNLKVTLISRNDEEKQLLVNELNEKGFKLSDEEIPIEWPEEVKNGKQTEGIAQFTLDRVIARGLCKIAFNYLAHTAPGAFIIGPDFDGIRNLIRNDQGNLDEFFFVNQPPILEFEKKFEIKETDGHLIVLEWEKTNLHCRLSLFGMWTFLIRLSRLHGGLWIPIKVGHHFEMKSRAVNPLVVMDKRFLINP